MPNEEHNGAARVRDMVLGALFHEGEPTDGAVLVESVVRRFGFHPVRLATIKPKLAALIREVVPDDFLKDHGEGMSFLKLCIDRNGQQWAEHRTLDDLVALAIATGLGGFCAPRKLWDALPGGMPYVFFDLRATEEAV